MIFMVLEAKNALGRIPHLNEDLLDIQAHYLDKGDPFYLALNQEDRVIGCMGYHAIPGTDHVRLQRLLGVPNALTVSVVLLDAVPRPVCVLQVLLRLLNVLVRGIGSSVGDKP
jgi:hypothetical protein